MAARDFGIYSLSEQQQLALESYTSVTNQDVEAAIPLLRRSQWNVEVRLQISTLLILYQLTHKRLLSQNFSTAKAQTHS